MKHLLLPFTLLFLAVGLSTAAEIKFSGFLDADMAVGVNDKFKNLGFQSNHELDLTMDAKFSDKVSVQLYATSVTTKEDPTDSLSEVIATTPAGGSPVSNRWSGLDFDGLALTWNATTDLTLIIGDLVYNGGQLGYYFYKRPIGYGAIMKEQFIRGVGLNMGGLSFYAGSSDSDNSLFKLYGSFALSLGDLGSLKPMADVTLGGFNTDWNTGIEIGLTPIKDLAVNGALGLRQNNGNKLTTTVLIEPAFSMGSASLALTYFQAFFDDAEKSNYDVPEEVFVYVEPGVAANDLLAFGLPLEWHDPDLDVNTDAFFTVVPTAYIYPAENVEWWIWTQYIAFTEGNNDPAFAAGSEIIVSF